ncbi:ATP-binding protein [Lachnotalea glycerini]|uniref:Rad50/SbcC-type AAA domain-containing protein n=1 Tax=Lachnotalea glycerini TaxID=1763509 RepID=A0A371J2N0_9FIRM|nr:AAA family ATPase [Lachnotalea glycerini]RDY27039.1 hypothetical protein CG710_021210 [Lachnotalea glycerini]
MRLIRCYIENFGKLSKFNYEFNERLNVIEEENGWGKTTLAAFMKAMFFGMEYKMGKSITERKRYMPWNGNRFGGYLIFEMENKQYKLERFFGKRDKDDTFALYDLARNTLSEDFSSNIGEDIWKVDRDSYEKTAFITLNESDLLNDIISSKLGDIDEQEADMEASSKALQILDNLIVRIKPKRGNGGLLGEKQERAVLLKSERKECKDSLAKMEANERWISEKEQELLEINQRILAIEKEQAKFALYEKKKHYNTIMQEYDSAKKELEAVQEFFKGKILTVEEMNRLEEETNEFINQKSNANSYQLTEVNKKELEDLSNQFKQGVPKSYELDECNSILTSLSNERTKLDTYVVSSEMQNSLQTLNTKYGKLNPDSLMIESYIEDYNQVIKLESEANSIKADMEHVDKKISDKKKENIGTKVSSLFYAGILLVVAGLFIAFRFPLIGIVAAIAGIILAAIAFARKKSSIALSDSTLKALAKEREQYLNKFSHVMKKRDELAAPYTAFLKEIGDNSENIFAALARAKSEWTEYLRLKSLLHEIEQKVSVTKESADEKKATVEKFLSKYYNTSVLNDYEEALKDLRKKITRYEELERLENAYQRANEIAREKEVYLKPILLFYYDTYPDSVKRAVSKIRELLIKHKEKQTVLEKAQAMKMDFEKKHTVLDLEMVELPTDTQESLEKEKLTYMDKKEDIINVITNYKKDNDILSLKADKMEDIESSMLQCQEDIDSLQKQIDLLTLTKDCMTDAKEELAAKYMGDISASFKKYINELDSKKTDKYHIDIRLNVMLEKEGQLHDSSALSKGMKDLIQICMRMALVEAVYKDVDKPILVLDDPFVNLDNDRLSHATSLLKKIGESYQTIYFICHDSRRAV